MCESVLFVGWLLQACHPLFLTEEVVPAVPSQQTTKDNGELYWMLIKYFTEFSPYLEFCWLHTHTHTQQWLRMTRIPMKFLAVTIFKHFFALNDWNFTWLRTHSTPFCYSSALSDAVLLYICMLWWLYYITLLMNEPLNSWRILYWLQIN